MPRFEIHIDEDPINPREDENIGTIYYSSSRYALGDVCVDDIDELLVELCQEIHPEFDPEDVPEPHREDAINGILNKHYIMQPVYAYIHSGIALSTVPFSCAWDSGQCGVIVARKGAEGLSDEQLINTLSSEVSEFSNYLVGEVYGYVILDDDGETLDSCWGFLGYGYCKSQAIEALSHYVCEEECC
jgi:hypothetical protein